MEELVDRAKNNDSDAFTHLILNIERDLYCIAKSRINDENDIEDIIQETMIIAFLNIKKLKNNSFFKTWIIRILINNCNKFYKRKKHNSLEEDKNLPKIGSTEIDLSNIEFENFISFYTTKEFSEILNKREGTICSKISRAKVKIKEKYKGEFY